MPGGVLLRRYSETRRRHPSAPVETPAQGIEREQDLLASIRTRADVMIATSDLSPHDLKAEVERWFATESGVKLALTVHSFSYKRGLPRGIDMVFDCRFLRNPYWEPSLRALSGRDEAVRTYVTQDPRYGPFFEHMHRLVELLLPAYREEGKAHLSIAFGCTGGQHRSVNGRARRVSPCGSRLAGVYSTPGIGARGAESCFERWDIRGAGDRYRYRRPRWPCS